MLCLIHYSIFSVNVLEMISGERMRETHGVSLKSVIAFAILCPTLVILGGSAVEFIKYWVSM